MSWRDLNLFESTARCVFSQTTNKYFFHKTIEYANESQKNIFLVKLA